MYVHASKYEWEKQIFFRDQPRISEQHRFSEQNEPLATNDKFIYEPMEFYGNATHNSPIPTPANGKGKQQLTSKVKRTRRGWGSKGKKSTKLTLFGNNANGVKAKKESLLNTLANYGNPSCVLIQETKLRFPGTFKIPGYQIFEKVRAGLGGGLLTAIDENLSPVLISTGSDEAEILVIQILV